VLIGGFGADRIAGGDGANIAIGDSGRIMAGDREAYGARLDALPRIPALITTMSPEIGGDDRIATGAGNDIVIGGAGSDTLVAGGGDDIALGDNGALVYSDERTRVATAPQTRLLHVRTSDYNDGGRDRIEGGAGDDVLIGGSAADSLDGDAGDDLVFGDQVSLERRAIDITSLRFQTLGATLLYGLGGNVAQIALLDGIARAYRDSNLQAPDWALYTVLDLLHSSALEGVAVPLGKVATYGDDYIAGGAGDDMVFGQLGNDTLLGDGALEDAPASAGRVPGPGDPLGALILNGSIERPTDGDDYIEGGGGSDVIFGGLGQDDLIGGSSSMFSLTTPDQRPDGNDYIFGGAGTRTAINSVTGDLADPHSADADTIVGDNGDIVRVVGIGHVDGAPGAPYISFAYDTSSGRKVVVRAVTLLDDRLGADEIHGESGDDTVYAGNGDDRVFGDGDDDDLIGGLGNDWLSGGTGQDGILGDGGRIRTHRGGIAEALYGTTGSPGAIGAVFKAALPDASNLGGDDVLFGGLGDDLLHGGAGDDAVSGAEALLVGYAADMQNGGLTSIVRSDYNRPYNPGDLLHYGLHQAGATLPTFGLYNEAFPSARIFVGGFDFFLNNDPAIGPKLPVTPSDGDDQVVGGTGHDWLVGGTGRDVLSGGDGDDLLNADDDLTTGGGANLFPDADPSYADVLSGGLGRDIFLTNGPQDRVLDAEGADTTSVPSNAGNPLPVTGDPGPVSSQTPPATAEQSLNPALDPGQLQLTPKKVVKKKKTSKKKKAKKKAKAKAKKKKAKAKKKKAKAKKKKPKKKGKKGRGKR
jgi:Ca2+-binding RTX toxin-like protein